MIGILRLADGEETTLTGTVFNVTPHVTRQHLPWAVIDLTVDDYDLIADVQVSPAMWEQLDPKPAEHDAVALRARVDSRDGTRFLVAVDCRPRPSELDAHLDVLLARYGVTQ